MGNIVITSPYSKNFRRGEFETGFERGGQTKEHTMLAKTAGVNKLVVLINKMDDPTVEWDQVRLGCGNLGRYNLGCCNLG